MGELLENLVGDFSASWEAGLKEAAIKRGVPEKYAGMNYNLVPTENGTFASVEGGNNFVSREFTTDDLDKLLVDPKIELEKETLSLERWRELQTLVAKVAGWKLVPYWKQIPEGYDFKDVEGEIPVARLAKIKATIQGDIHSLKNWRDTYRYFLVEGRYQGWSFTDRDNGQSFAGREWKQSDGSGSLNGPSNMLAVQPISQYERDQLSNAKEWCLAVTGKPLEEMTDEA